LLPGVPRRTDPQVGLALAIRKTRTDADLNQKTLAERLELDPSQMSRLEQGELNPSWGTVKRIAVALEVTLPDLAALAEDFERRLGREDTNGSR
jgi:transcriptional regulator with XRE-family HTH domain